MPTTDYLYPNQVENQDVRTPHWTYTENVENAEPWEGATEGSDPSGHPHANITNLPAASNSDSLWASDYGFTIPLNARIDGVQGVIYRNGKYLTDKIVSLVYNGSSLSNKGKNQTRSDVLLQVDTYGSSTDKWGASVLLPSLVNDSDFTFKITVYNSDTASHTGYLYSMPLRVTYTNPTYSLSSSLPGFALIDSFINYTITLTATNSVDNGEPIPVDVPIPAGFTFLNSYGDGAYDEATHTWTTTLRTVSGVKKAELHLTLECTTLGEQSQTVTETEFSTTITDTCEILETDSDNISRAEATITDTTTLNNLIDGEEYILSAYHYVHDTGVEGIWTDGIRNNRIAVVNGDEILGTRPSAQDTWVRDYVVFTYDSAETLTIKLYGQYEAISEDGEDQWAGFVLKQVISEGGSMTGPDYDEGDNLLSDPSALLSDVSSATLSLPALSDSAPYTFTTDVITEPEGTNPFFTGFELVIDTTLTESTGVTVQLENQDGVESLVKTQNYPSSEDEIRLGSSTDLWGFESDDLMSAVLNINLLFSNYESGTETPTYSNLRLILYYQDDETYSNYGFTINGVHSRNYNIFLRPEEDISEGPEREFETLSMPRMDGEIITNQTLKSKEIEFEFLIWGDTIEEAKERLRNAVAWMSNDRDIMYRPIPDEWIFDIDPTRAYLAVLAEPVDVKRKYTTLECSANLIVPSGVATNTEPTVTGAIGTNNGVVSVRPLITIISDGGDSISLLDTVSGQEIIIDNDMGNGTTVYVDCENRTVYINVQVGSTITPVYYTEYVNINTVWFNFVRNYNILATGCTVENVTFYESY